MQWPMVVDELDRNAVKFHGRIWEIAPMPIEAVLSGLAVLCGLFFCAIVLRRRLNLELRAALPPPTGE